MERQGSVKGPRAGNFGEEIGLTPEATIENEDSDFSPIKSRWQENHGNLLMSFVGLILVVGSGLLLYRQNRFVPPRFPEAEMIVQPPTETTAAALDRQSPDRQSPDRQSPDRQSPGDFMMLRVAGAANNLGSIKIAIYGNEETFNDPDRALATNTLPLENGVAEWAIPVSALPSEIAIAAYHDENEDGQLTLNRFGIPSERYGFSRNARGLTGPPSFRQALIARPKGGTSLELFIR
jgi:uncharacterized protein (DUF2141 family)